jgi:hypothetical protein
MWFFPHGDNPEAVSGLHDTGRVIAKAGVERGLVPLKDFIDAQLLDHDLISLEKRWGQIVTFKDRRVGKA